MRLRDAVSLGVLIQGLVKACFFILLMTVTLISVPYDKNLDVLSLSNFVRITAGLFGTSIATNSWQVQHV